jgi:hypothetical protein
MLMPSRVNLGLKRTRVFENEGGGMLATTPNDVIRNYIELSMPATSIADGRHV